MKQLNHSLNLPPNRLSKTFAVWLAVILGIGVIAFPSVPVLAKTPSHAFAAGAIAPDFTLQSLSGRNVTLSRLRGKPVVLNFWATWCPPCRSEMPDLQLIQEKVGQNIHIIGITQKEPEEDVHAFLQENGYSWTFLHDGSGDVAATYGVRAYPTTVVINAEGRITGVHVGMMELPQMVELIKTAL
jgi:peroxiredoxin